MKKKHKQPQWAAIALAAATLATATTTDGAKPHILDWQVVVNNGFEIPDNPGRFYNSYNPPSVSSGELVVFRARSTGRQQGPVSGIYTRDMATLGAINRIADRDTEVPQPNNTEYPVPGGSGEWILSTYNEFPSFPRIAILEDMIATRGNHKPVWTYAEEEMVQLAAHDGGEEDEDETRAGTTGVYVNLNAKGLLGELTTGASLLGAVPELSNLFQVPVPNLGVSR